MRTLLLDQTLWDLVLDASGNIAVAENPYQIAQDVASAIRLFRGELWYGPPIAGVPYFESILGQQTSVGFLKAQFVAAAMTVPDVGSAVCFLDSIQGRTLTGQVRVTMLDGTVAVASVGTAASGSPFILGQSALGGSDTI